MSGTFSVEVEQVQPVAVLRLRGLLDTLAAADLRMATLECLAEQPTAILIDVSDVDLAGGVADEAVLTVLSTLARQSERWPGARLVVVGADGALTSVAERLGAGGYAQVCPDGDAAMRELTRWPQPPRRRERIAPDRLAPGLARAAVAEFCAENGFAGDCDAEQLVASELVTNAVVHARTHIELTLRLVPPVLHIAVRDAGAGRPHIVPIADEPAGAGRGLLLVDALTAAWGSFAPAVGMVVWASVRVQPLPRGASRARSGKDA